MVSLKLQGAALSGVLFLVCASACARPSIRSEPVVASDDIRGDLAEAVRSEAHMMSVENLQCPYVVMSATAETENGSGEDDVTAALGVTDLGDVDDEGYATRPSVPADAHESAGSKAKAAPNAGLGDDTARAPRSASEAAERTGTNKRALEGPNPKGAPSPRDRAPEALSPTVPVETTPSR